VMVVDTPSAARRWLRVSARPAAAPGPPGRVVATFIDITNEHRHTEELAERELHYRILADSSTDAIVRIDPAGFVRYASPAAERNFGTRTGMNAFHEMQRLTHPDDLVPAIDALRNLRRGASTSETIEMRVRDTEGRWRWFDSRVSLAEGVPGVVSVSRDISERTAMEREMADAEELFRQAFEEAPIGTAMTTAGVDGSATIVRANRLYAHALGLEPEDLVGRSNLEFVHPDDRAAALAARHRLVAGLTARERMQLRIVRRDGSVVWHTLTRSVLRDQAGAVRYILAQVEDASETHDLVSRLAVQAHTDPLTGLANRRGLETELTRLLEDPLKAAHAAVFFLDLDGFKEVNDRLGHAAGDRALRIVGERLLSLTRAHDTVARVGGDEFVILARHVGGPGAEVVLAERFAQILVHLAHELPVEVRASVGSARPAPGDTAGGLLERADRAMYRSKRRAPVSDERP